MTLSKYSLLVIILAVLFNNLAWVYIVRNTNAACVENNAIGGHTAGPSQNTNTVKFSKPVSTGVVPAGNGTDTDQNSDFNEDALPEPSPEGINTEEIDIPVALSQSLLFERQMDFEYFFQSDTDKKLETIETLSPRGEALDLLKEIIETEKESNIRIAAINRLKDENNYAATTLLLDTLNDPETDVSLSALSTIVANGDRTLLPLLKNKLASLPGGSIHNQYAQLIHQLEYSVTMEMDSSNNE